MRIQKNGKFVFTELIAQPQLITLRDKKRNIDILLQEGMCKWKKSNQSKWSILDRGSFVNK